jgi:SAM-dependent methyltransferase
MTATTTLDLDAIKARQKAMWMMGDFGQIARFTEENAGDFVRRLAIGEGMGVLDVACGTGNVAIPAAQAGAIVTAIDIAPNLLEQGRLRARREGLDISFQEADMEDLPYRDGAFDLVVSTFGVMFATRPKRVAQELTRVCKRGGRIALANWTARGFIGQIHEVTAKYLPVTTPLPSPFLWGEETTVLERLREGIGDLRLTTAIAQLHYPYSIPQVVELHRQYLGPARMTFEATPEAKRPALIRDLEALYAQHNRAQDGTVRIEAEYLQVIATKV